MRKARGVKHGLVPKGERKLKAEYEDLLEKEEEAFVDNWLHNLCAHNFPVDMEEDPYEDEDGLLVV